MGDSASVVKELILRSAAIQFAEHGYHQTSTRQIADRAGLELSTVFHFFASKAEIMNAILKHDLGVAVAAAERQLEAVGSPAHRLYRYLVEDLGQALRSPYAVGINATSGLLSELDFAGARARSDRLNNARAELIREGIEAGELIEADPEVASRALEWTIEGALREQPNESGDDPDAVARLIAELCLRALVIDFEIIDRIRRASSSIPSEDMT